MENPSCTIETKDCVKMIQSFAEKHEMNANKILAFIGIDDLLSLFKSTAAANGFYVEDLIDDPEVEELIILKVLESTNFNKETIQKMKKYSSKISTKDCVKMIQSFAEKHEMNANKILEDIGIDDLLYLFQNTENEAMICVEKATNKEEARDFIIFKMLKNLSR